MCVPCMHRRRSKSVVANILRRSLIVQSFTPFFFFFWQPLGANSRRVTLMDMPFHMWLVSGRPASEKKNSNKGFWKLVACPAVCSALCKPRDPHTRQKKPAGAACAWCLRSAVLAPPASNNQQQEWP